MGRGRLMVRPRQAPRILGHQALSQSTRQPLPVCLCYSALLSTLKAPCQPKVRGARPPAPRHHHHHHAPCQSVSTNVQSLAESSLPSSSFPPSSQSSTSISSIHPRPSHLISPHIKPLPPRSQLCSHHLNLPFFNHHHFQFTSLLHPKLYHSVSLSRSLISLLHHLDTPLNTHTHPSYTRPHPNPPTFLPFPITKADIIARHRLPKNARHAHPSPKTCRPRRA